MDKMPSGSSRKLPIDSADLGFLLRRVVRADWARFIWFKELFCNRSFVHAIAETATEPWKAEGELKLNVGELRDGMKRVNVQAKVVEKRETREVMSRFKDETYKVATAIVADETGSIKLTLWNEQIEQVNVNDTVTVENGYVTSFKGEIQLNVGKFGKLTVNQ
jgi:replication factor A1